MRELDLLLVSKKVEELFIKANKSLPCDIADALLTAQHNEQGTAKSALNIINQNIIAAKELNIPICQDTGLAVVFLEVGQDIHFVGGNLYDAINKGVEAAYVKGLLRLSVVNDPLIRENTNTNTPAIIHTKIVDGENLKITVAPKGMGSENMSGIRMLNPSDSKEGVINAVLDIVKNAGSNACPPMVIGVGIGGNFEECALLSKTALIRDINTSNKNPFYKQLEDELLEKINELNIGPQGFGGKTTALKVNIETLPTHIAGLPVAVNIGCYVNRHISEII